MNYQTKTVFLLALISGLFLGLGYLLGGSKGMSAAFLFSLIMNFGAYWFSDKIVLGMHGARPIPRGHESGVYEIVEELSQRARLPMPKIYWIPEHAPNAFATGRDPEHAAVAVTDGILRILSPRELRAVLAHELSHIQNRDILVATLVASLASAIMYLSHMMRFVGFSGSSRSDVGGRGVHPLAFLFTLIFAPLIAALIQFSISRTREYYADESGARMAQDPEGLALALEKISDPSHQKQYQRQGLDPELQAACAHLYLVNHFSGEAIMSLFSTHPPVKERIRRLLALR